MSCRVDSPRPQPTTTPTPPAAPAAPAPVADATAPGGDGLDPNVRGALALIGIAQLRDMGIDQNVLNANPELKAEVSKLMDMARGVGAMAGINVEKLMLPDAELRAYTQEALKSGQVDGRRRPNPTGADVDAAMNRDWRPTTGAPIGSTGTRPLSQLDSNATLGNGPRTIRQSGCLLTSMAMVSNTLTGGSMGVVEANRRAMAAGGFSGSNLNVGNAAQGLGMRLTSRASFQGNTGAIDRALQQGKPVVVGVDYKAGSSSAMGRTDHFVAITGRNADGSYTGIDSAGGKPLTFRPDGNGGLVATTTSGKRYSLSEVMTFDRR